MPVKYDPLKGVIGRGTPEEKAEARSDWFDLPSGEKPVKSVDRPLFEKEMKATEKRMPFNPKNVAKALRQQNPAIDLAKEMEQKENAEAEKKLKDLAMSAVEVGQEKPQEEKKYDWTKIRTLLNDMAKKSALARNAEAGRMFKKVKEKEMQIPTRTDELYQNIAGEKQPDRKFVKVGEQEFDVPESFNINKHFVMNPETFKKEYNLEKKPWTTEEIKDFYDYIESIGKTPEDYAPLIQKWNIPSLEEAEKLEAMKLLNAE